MRTIRQFTIALILACTTSGAEAHEFWIDPVVFQVDPGDELVADIRVGQEFSGSGYAHIPQNIRRAEIAAGAALVPIESRIGDRPAIHQLVPDAGLAVLLHVTSDSRLTYTEADKFVSFVTHKDAEWVLARHKERGLPETGFGEIYSRYAKSLVAVGDGAGADRAFGLETEIVALANPYTDDLTGGMPVQVLYRGEPRAKAQVEIFEKNADGDVTVYLARTDGSGVAVIPLRPGHRYMLDAVVLREPAAELAQARDVVWESLWANLTFEVTDRR